jgi:2-octaprenyl-6-methoxyphenol hydroxylase
MQREDLKQEYDIVIVGGGMVGTTLACALAAWGPTSALSVLIVDAQMPAHKSNKAGSNEREKASFDSRSTALSSSSKLILERFGLWPQLSAGVCPIKQIHVSDQGRFGATKLDSADFGVPALGYVVENAAFGAALNSTLAQLAHCAMLAPARVISATPSATGMDIELDSGQVDASCEPSRVAAKLLVIAEGGGSSLCDQLGIMRSNEDYGQHALIANVGLSQSHKGVAFERFTNSGPLAMLPLLPVEGEPRASLVWTLGADESEYYAALDDAELLARLQEKFGGRLGRLKRIGSRALYPLSLRVAQEQIRPGLVLLGNVAHTLHPVAGQGMNLSLRDIEALVEALSDIQDEGLGSMATLQRYLAAREADQSLMISVTDGLTKLFSSDAQTKVWLRKAGLLSIDLIPALKKTFGARAMGFD